MYYVLSVIMQCLKVCLVFYVFKLGDQIKNAVEEKEALI